MSKEVVKPSIFFYKHSHNNDTNSAFEFSCGKFANSLLVETIEWKRSVIKVQTDFNKSNTFGKTFTSTFLRQYSVASIVHVQ